MTEAIKTIVAYAKRFVGVWNEAKRYEQLYRIVDDVHARNILEIGTWTGERAQRLIRTAQRHHGAGNVFYVGFDLFETEAAESRTAELSKKAPRMETVKEALEQTGARVALYQGDTNEVLPGIVHSLPKMDFIYIDGGHSLKTIQNDWECVRRLMHEKTVVIFDDYWPNKLDGGAKPIVDNIDRSQYDVSLLPVFDVFLNPEYGRLVIKFAQVQLRRV